MPVLGPVVSKVAISRFTRTLGTLVSSGVPILQALTIVRETSGNVIIGQRRVGQSTKASRKAKPSPRRWKLPACFPPMVISMVDVGEQTGALPEMLMKIADNYDEEVDNAVAAMTSLLGTDHDRFPGGHGRQHRHRDVPAPDCHDQRDERSA